VYQVVLLSKTIDNIPDVWLVGYGLDDCGTKRGFRNLYAVPKNSNIPSSPDDIIFDNEDLFNDKFNSIKIIPSLPNLIIPLSYN